MTNLCQFCNQACFAPLPPEPTIRAAYRRRGVEVMATCAGGRAAEKKLLGYSYDDVEEIKMGVETQLNEIIEDSPADEHGRKWAIFGQECLWWSGAPGDCRRVGWLLRCPHCGGLIDQAPLEQFIERAKANPQNYGSNGLRALLAAHHRQALTCRTSWNRYKIDDRS